MLDRSGLPLGIATTAQLMQPKFYLLAVPTAHTTRNKNKQ